MVEEHAVYVLDHLLMGRSDGGVSHRCLRYSHEFRDDLILTDAQ